VDFELDHVLVWVGPGAPEAERLVELGLTEGTPNVHAGQGTANRRFFFRNAMLELIWVHDETEARAGPGARLGIHERWRHRETGASPFGLERRTYTRASLEIGLSDSHAPSYAEPSRSCEW
jgi:Glyoxalase-like domain